ncbi:MAG: lactate utilization protein [Bacteroidetes bacterium]|nr:lactate utilization protein [Bacteroidota bacterium]
MEQELLNKFATELIRVGGEFSLASSKIEILKIVNKILSQKGCNTAVLSSHPFFDSLKEMGKGESGINIFTIEQILSLAGESDYTNLLREKLSQTDAGINYAEYLIAETGSAVVVNTQSEPSYLSLLPEISIIVSKSNRVVKDMSEALNRLRTENLFDSSGCITFITGPSRTADIEKVLITGVHGPKKLYVIVINF